MMNRFGGPHCRTLLWLFRFGIASFAFCSNPVIGQSLSGDSQAETERPAATTPGTEDWARDFLRQDPLAAQDSITLADLREAMGAPNPQSNVIAGHFWRVSDATVEQKVEFLTEAMRSSHPDVSRQAAVELDTMHALEDVVRELLLQYLSNDDPNLRNAAIVGLQRITIPVDQLTETYLAALLVTVGDDDPVVAESAYNQLLDLGPSTVPTLLTALSEKHPHSLKIARLISEIVGRKLSRQSPAIAYSAPGPMGDWPVSGPDDYHGPEATIGKSIVGPTTDHAIRSVDPTQPTPVTVYFGTNREVIESPQRPSGHLLRYPLLALILLATLILLYIGGVMPTTGQRSNSTTTRWLIPLTLVCGIGWALVMFRNELQANWEQRTGVRFGPRRDAAKPIHYGTCIVSIPPRHQVGMVERPTLGPENEQEHVVLKRVQTLEEEAYFQLVKAKVAELPRGNRSCFVFIHGFNVDFDSAARRTAQMHYDLKFECVPIFFSWPSRANLRHYFSDRNEIEFSRYVIKQFLLDVAQRVDAERIHVIAHSMGADATCRAIADLGDYGKIFDQIILAAPDIDSEVFRTQIAPRVVATANRTTMYCSRKDWALLLSRNFNDSSRAGDSSRGALVVQGVDTVDASDIDTDLLGHSYYGDCLPILDDVNLMMRASLPPLERRLRPWPIDQQLLYWTLPDDRTR